LTSFTAARDSKGRNPPNGLLPLGKLGGEAKAPELFFDLGEMGQPPLLIGVVHGRGFGLAVDQAVQKFGQRFLRSVVEAVNRILSA
jgi:hypothetical protein